MDNENINQEIDLPLIPKYYSKQTASVRYSHNALHGKESSILLLPETKYKLENKFSFHLDIPELTDWRLNNLEINKEEQYLIIAIDTKVALLPFNFTKSNMNNSIGKLKYVIEAQDVINQVKLMKDKEDTYILALENAGLMHCKKICYDRAEDKVTESEYKKFNCCVDTSDNSIWSIDCFYPYAVVGGNHKCVVVINVQAEAESEGGNIKHNVIFRGNKHNVPYVTFSPSGEFIACASIDSKVKVYDTYSGKLLQKISNDNEQWGWGVKFIEKKKVTISTHNTYANTNTQVNPDNSNTMENLIKYLLGIRNLDNRETYSYDILSEEKTSTDLDNESLARKYYRNSLLNYYILCTYKDCLYLNTLTYKDDDSLTQINLGKINLIHNYFKKATVSEEIVSYSLISNMKSHLEYSRYEFILVSNALNVLIVGNREGDIQIYDLEIKIYNEDNKIGMKEEPLSIIDCNSRIAGMKLIDQIDSKYPDKNFCEIYVMKINRTLECFKLRRSDF